MELSIPLHQVGSSSREGYTPKQESLLLQTCSILGLYSRLCCFPCLVSWDGCKLDTGFRTLADRLIFRTVVIADTSLYIPMFEEEPVSVTVLGVGPDGRTTWRIEPSEPTGTVSPRSESFTGKTSY